MIFHVSLSSESHPICDDAIEYFVLGDTVGRDEAHQARIPVMKVEHGIEQMGDEGGTLTNRLLSRVQLGGGVAQWHQELALLSVVMYTLVLYVLLTTYAKQNIPALFDDLNISQFWGQCD